MSRACRVWEFCGVFRLFWFELKCPYNKTYVFEHLAHSFTMEDIAGGNGSLAVSPWVTLPLAATDTFMWLVVQNLAMPSSHGEFQSLWSWNPEWASPPLAVPDKNLWLWPPIHRCIFQVPGGAQGLGPSKQVSASIDFWVIHVERNWTFLEESVWK